jgi:hypothetical protein
LNKRVGEKGGEENFFTPVQSWRVGELESWREFQKEFQREFQKHEKRRQQTHKSKQAPRNVCSIRDIPVAE